MKLKNQHCTIATARQVKAYRLKFTDTILVPLFRRDYMRACQK